MIFKSSLSGDMSDLMRWSLAPSDIASLITGWWERLESITMGPFLVFGGDFFSFANTASPSILGSITSSSMRS